MKSMKLASGFAVSALALAIAGTATAETTTEVEFAGELKVNTVFDFESETMINNMPGFSSAEDEYSLYGVWSVTNGPFSGDILVGIEEDEAAGNTGGYVEIDGLRVDEGPISFGQIGRITDSARLYENLTDENDLFGEDTSTRIGVDAAFRYTLADLGLRVQAEGNGGHPFGFAAALNQDLDVAEVWFDAQFRQRTEAQATGNAADTGMEDGETTVGAAVVASPVDQVTLSAAFRMTSVTEQSAFALKADVQATDQISAFVLVTDRDLTDEATDDSMVVRGGGALSFAPFTLEGGYEALAAEVGEGLLFTKLSYSEGQIGASAEFNYALEGFSGATDADFELVLGGDYTTASNIIYGAEYTFTGDDWYGGKENQLELFANYSF